VSDAGDALTNDCRTCHAIVAQGPAGQLQYADDVEGLDFEHPGDLGDVWQAMACPDCHGS
jgi:hypothetical protein